MDGAQDLDLHLQLVNAEAKVQVCVRYAPDMASAFTARMEKWRGVHSAALTRGAELAESRGFNKQPASIRQLAEFQAKILEALPEDDRSRRCEELLESFVVPAQK